MKKIEDIFHKYDLLSEDELKRHNLKVKLDRLLDMSKEDIKRMFEFQNDCELEDADFSKISIDFNKQAIEIEYECTFKFEDVHYITIEVKDDD